MRTHSRTLGLVAAIFVIGINGLGAATETFMAGQRVRLKVDVPPGYSFQKNTNEYGVTLVLLENPVWKIGLRVIISPDYTADAQTEDWQRDIVMGQSSQFLVESKEQDYHWKPLNPRQGSGVYSIFTDAQAQRIKDLEPDSYVYVVVGAKVIKRAPMVFQIYTNDISSPEYREIFDLMVNGFDKG